MGVPILRFINYNKLIMKQLLISIIVLFGLLTFTQCAKKQQVYENIDAFINEVIENVSAVSPEELSGIIDTAETYYLIDVREPEEYHPGYIAESVNLPRGILETYIDEDNFWESQDLEKPYKDELVIVYSKKGKRSILAAATLQKMGYTNVKYLEGGYKNWEMTYPNNFERDEPDFEGGDE